MNFDVDKAIQYLAWGDLERDLHFYTAVKANHVGTPGIGIDEVETSYFNRLREYVYSMGSPTLTR